MASPKATRLAVRGDLTDAPWEAIQPLKGGEAVGVTKRGKESKVMRDSHRRPGDECSARGDSAGGSHPADRPGPSPTRATSTRPETLVADTTVTPSDSRYVLWFAMNDGAKSTGLLCSWPSSSSAWTEF